VCEVRVRGFSLVLTGRWASGRSGRELGQWRSGGVCCREVLLFVFFVPVEEQETQTQCGSAVAEGRSGHCGRALEGGGCECFEKGRREQWCNVGRGRSLAVLGIPVDSAHGWAGLSASGGAWAARPVTGEGVRGG